MIAVKDTYQITNNQFRCIWANCGRQRKTPELVYFHYARDHQGQLKVNCPHSCKWDTNGFTTSQGLEYHMKAKHDDAFITCPVPGCSKTCRQRGDIMGHLRAPTKHGIKLPVVDRRRAKSAQYYTDCKAVYQAWCDVQNFDNAETSFFDSVFETFGASSRGHDEQPVEQGAEQATAKPLPSYSDQMMVIDLRADLRNLNIKAIAELFPDDAHHEHYVDYFACNLHRLFKIWGSQELHAVIALGILHWDSRRHRYQDSLLHDILNTIKRLDLQSYDTMHGQLRQYTGSANDTYYACIYGMDLIAHLDSLFLDFEDLDIIIQAFNREEDVAPIKQLGDCKDECWLVLADLQADSEQCIASYQTDTLSEWLNRHPATDVSIFELQHRNFEAVLLEDETLLLTIIDSIGRLDMTELANTISAKVDCRQKLVNDLKTNPSHFLQLTGFLFARALSWYSQYPRLSSSLAQHLYTSYTQLSAYNSDVIEYKGSTMDTFYQAIYGCYLSILLDPATIAPQLIARIVLKFGEGQQKYCASHFLIWFDRAQAAFKAARGSDVENKSLQLVKPLRRWLKRSPRNKDLLGNEMGTFISPVFLKNGLNGDDAYVELADGEEELV